MTAQEEPEAKPRRRTRLGGGLRPIFSRPWLAIAILATPFVALRVVYRAFRIPSGSMYPTLEIGDDVFVSKTAYGFFEKTLPLRGALVVYEHPYPPAGAEGQSFIKRVVGVAGDVVEVEAGHAVLNGWRVPSCSVGHTVARRNGAGPEELDLFVEYLDGAQYLMAIGDSAETHQGPFRVPSGEVFVLGDNRVNSADSRSYRDGKGGGVPLEKIGGRMTMVYFPFARFTASLDPPRLPEDSVALERALAACLAKRPKLEDTKPPPPKAP